MSSAPIASPAATVQLQNLQSGASGATALATAGDAEVKRVSSKTGGKTDPAAIDKTAREFEAMFLSVMLNEMFKGIDMSKGPFGGGHGEDAFKGMLVDQYGKNIAERGGLGIAASVRRQMLLMQEAASSQGATASQAKGGV